MKKLYIITLLIASMLLSYGGGKGEVQKEGGLPVLDISKEYPE